MKRIEIQRQYDSLIKLVSLQITVLKVEIVQLIKKTGSLETQIKQAELDLNNWIKNASITLSVEEYKSQLFTKQFETEKKIKEMEYEIKSTHDHINKNKVTIKELENNILELEKEKSLLLKKL